MVRVHGGQVPSTAQRDAAPDRNRGSFDTPKLKIVGQGAVTLDLIATADNPSVTLRILETKGKEIKFENLMHSLMFLRLCRRPTSSF